MNILQRFLQFARRGVHRFEDAQLHCFDGLGGGGLGFHAVGAHRAAFDTLLFELVEDMGSALHDATRHTRHARHVDAETVLAAAGHEFTQEDDLLPHFAHRDAVVFDALELVRQLVELVVMCGEQRFGPVVAVAVEVLGDAPGNADAVVGAGAPPDLIQQDE